MMQCRWLSCNRFCIRESLESVFIASHRIATYHELHSLITRKHRITNWLSTHTLTVLFSKSPLINGSTVSPLNCRLLIYGIYCSRVEIAIAVLDLICKEKEDVRLKLEVRHLSNTHIPTQTPTFYTTPVFQRPLVFILCTTHTLHLLFHYVSCPLQL